MAITKETQIGKIEVVGKYKSVQVRTDTVVIEDSEELSRKFHRHIFFFQLFQITTVVIEFIYFIC